MIDVFEALTHKRPYKEAWPVEEALKEIANLRGTKFDPRVVDAFFSMWKDGATEEVESKDTARSDVANGPDERSVSAAGAGR